MANSLSWLKCYAKITLPFLYIIVFGFVLLNVSMSKPNDFSAIDDSKANNAQNDVDSLLQSRIKRSIAYGYGNFNKGNKTKQTQNQTQRIKIADTPRQKKIVEVN